MSIRQLVKKNYILYSLLTKILNLYRRYISLYFRDNIVVNLGYGKLFRDIIGSGNYVEVGKNTYLNKSKIRIRGNNNRIIFYSDCYIGPDCSFWLEGNNVSIIIGSNTSFTRCVHFCAQENNMSIEVGTDCMFSNNIIVRTSDSHPIYVNQKRINYPKPVKVGNHVWIAPNSVIMKGANIGDGSIVGSNTMVNKDVPQNSLVVGYPARIVKEDVSWTRESLF